MSSSSSSEQALNDLRVAKLVVNNLGHTFENFQTHAFTILTLSEQWRNWQSSFSNVEASLSSRIKELELKEREIGALAIKVDNVQKEVELRQKRLNSEEKLVSERVKAVELRENHIRELYEVMELEKRQISEHSRAMQSKEKQFAEGFKKIKAIEAEERRIGERCRVVEVREKQMNERSEAIELEENRISKCSMELETREKQIDERCKGLELIEKEIVERGDALKSGEKKLKEGLQELNLKEKEMEEDFRDLELKREKVDEHRKELELKMKQIDERSKMVESREKQIDERCKAHELKEKEITDRGKALKSGEKKLEEGLQELNLKEKEMEEDFQKRCRDLELKREKVDEHRKELELKMKQIDKHCKMVESREKQCDDAFRALELKEKKFKESCEKFKAKEKEVDELCQTVESKEKQMNERFKELDLKEKQVINQLESFQSKEKFINDRCLEIEVKEKEAIESLELREKQLKERSQELESKEKEMNKDFQVRWKALELKQEQVDGQCKEIFEMLESKEKQSKDASRALELREKRIDERCKAVESKEKQVNENWEILKLKEKQTSDSCKVLELKEKQINERCKEIELKEKQVNESCQAVESNKKKVKEGLEALDKLCKVMESKEKEISDRCIAMEAKANQINMRQKGQDLREKQINQNGRKLRLRENKVNALSQSLELKEKELNKLCQAQESKEKQIDGPCEALQLMKKTNEPCNQLDLMEKKMGNEHSEVNSEQIKEQQQASELTEKKKNDLVMKNQPSKNQKKIKQTQLRSCGTLVVQTEPCKNLAVDNNGSVNSFFGLNMTTDGKTLQKFLNHRANKHDSLGEEVSRFLKSATNPTMLVLDAIDGFFPPHLMKGDVEYEASVVRSSCLLLLEQLMYMKPTISNTVTLEAAKVAIQWREKMRMEEDWDMLALGFLLLVVTYHLSSFFLMDDLRRVYEMVDHHRLAPELSNRLVLHKSNNVSSSLTQASCGDIHTLCQNMNASGVRLYLIKHVKEQSIMHEQILDALKFAPDAAKLVLDATQSFHGTDLDEVHRDDNKTSCIFLLEQLMKLSPYITYGVREEATAFAATWKAILKEGDPHMDIYGYLQFLAAYKLANSDNADDILSLFKTFFYGSEVYRPDRSVHLCHALGIEKKIPGLIQYLIERQLRPSAVKYICVFKMEHNFPPVPLLEAHLELAKKRAEERLNTGDSKAMDVAVEMELAAYEDVLRCISHFRIPFEIPPYSLALREHLENEKQGRASRKRSTPCATPTPPEEQVKRARVDPPTQTRPHVLPNGPSPTPNGPHLGQTRTPYKGLTCGKCGLCGDSTHRADNCPKKRNGLCFNCGERNHFSKNCPKKFKNRNRSNSTNKPSGFYA